MKKYMLAFYGGNRALRYENLKQADKNAQEKHRAAWSAWMSELMKADQLESGYPLESEGKMIDSDGAQDYHFPDTTEGGFIILKAESLAQAAELAGSSPIIKNDGYILVRPCGEMQ